MSRADLTRCSCVSVPPLLQVRDPLFGRWLDVYLAVLQPLVLPVGGLLGSTYP